MVLIGARVCEFVFVIYIANDRLKVWNPIASSYWQVTVDDKYC